MSAKIRRYFCLCFNWLEFNNDLCDYHAWAICAYEGVCAVKVELVTFEMNLTGS